VAEARIELLAAELGYEAARRLLAGQGPPAALASTRADRDGAFTFEAPAPGCYRVAISAPGYLALDYLLPASIEDRQLPPAQLVQAVRMTVRAVGERGEPLAGVLLALRRTEVRFPAPPQPVWEPAERVGRTGADGQLAFHRAAGEAVTVAAIDPRFFGQELSLAEPAGTGGKSAAPTLRLVRHPPLMLEARGPGGQPVAGALLRLITGRPIAMAGGDGRLEVAFAGQQAAWAAMGPLIFEGPGGEVAAEISSTAARGGRLPVALERVRAVDGQLIEAAGGLAVGGGLVWAERQGNRFTVESVAATARARADGSFQLRLPPGESVWLKAAAPGHVAQVATAPGAGAPWRIKLARALDLVGSVVDTAGRGVAGARVTAQVFAGGEPVTPVITDPAGRFRLRALASGQPYKLEAAAAGYAKASVLAPAAVAGPRQPAPGPAPPEIRIVLATGHGVVGKVVDRAGQPVPGIAILAVPAREARALGNLSPRALESWDLGDDVLRTSSEAQGTFELRHLNPGTYRLVAGGPGYVAAEQPAVAVPAYGSRTDVGRIVLEASATIEGLVIDRRGAAVADAEVRLSSSTPARGTADLAQLGWGRGGDLVTVSTGPDGRFRVADLRRDLTFEIAVRHPDHAPARAREIKPPTREPLRIELQDGGRLTGLVSDGAGQAVFGAEVRLERVAGGDLGRFEQAYSPPAVTDAGGGFTISGLGAGTFDLTVTAAGYRPARRGRIEVAAGQENAPIDVVLESGSSLSGRVADAAGRPCPGVRVVASPSPTGDLRSDLLRRRDQATAVVDAGGRYAISGLDSGRHRVQVLGSRSRSVELDIRPGQNELDLVAEPEDQQFQSVSGRVVDATGQPVGGAALILAPAPEGFRSFHNVLSLSDGSFIFMFVQPGHYELKAAARGYVPVGAPGPVDVSEAAVEGLTLTLERAGAVIAGQLTGLEPEDVAQLRVGATALEEGPNMYMNDWPGQVAGEVDGSGAYRIADLPPGPWLVTVISGSGHSASGQVTLEPGAAEAHLDLDLGGGYTLSGEVSAERQPAAGAHLMLVGAGVRGAETAADGTFRISGLKAGTYRLVIVDPLRVGTFQLVVEVSADLDLTLDITPGKVQGRVVTARAEAVAGATVEVEAIDPRRPMPQMLQAVTDPSGSFEIPSLPANAYRVTARKEGFQPGGVEVNVAADETAVVELKLAKNPGQKE
ncbi:MAG TPA: carboxypeptidase-like regulatory domain-containing protein, partial [Thermoanaerobaculia bacterium]|nr:carboxypeptidase-like regulatory domain-containing protein [Thermoanaerobaculia bacterium]